MAPTVCTRPSEPAWRRTDTRPPQQFQRIGVGRTADGMSTDDHQQPRHPRTRLHADGVGAGRHASARSAGLDGLPSESLLVHTAISTAREATEWSGPARLTPVASMPTYPMSGMRGKRDL
jgi:hypothetical protein